LGLVLAVSAADVLESITWSSKHSSCDRAKKTLVFVFDDFSVAEFSKTVGAYHEVADGKCPGCGLTLVKSIAQKQPYTCIGSLATLPVVDVDGSDVKAVVEAARTATGKSVIRMNVPVSQVASMQDAVMYEAIQEAQKAADGDVIFTLTGANKAIAAWRTLQTSTTTTLLVRMAPDTFIGLVLLISGGALLIFTMCCCMDSIESQTKYAKSYPLKGKELN